MKRLFVVPLILVAVGLIVQACSTSVADDNAGTTTINAASVQIEGMACEMGCAKMIEEKLGALEGVVEASVDFDAKLASVRFHEEQVSGEQLVQTIEALHDGQYEVLTVEVSKVEVTNDEVDESAEKSEKNLKEQAANLPLKAPEGRFTFNFPNIFDIFSRLAR